MHSFLNTLACAVVVAPVFFGVARAETVPRPVQFSSADGHTTLVGYLFAPSDGTAAKHGAVVMMHGRAGAYSSAAHGIYDSTTLSKRHAFWGHFWADQGYVALLVDGFSPRGYPGGFPVHSYSSRPEAVNEVTVRPLDAYGALAYLRTRPDVDADRIALQGWSNGGSATIAAMSDEMPATVGLAPARGFKGAVAFYPACALHDRYKTNYRPYAPLRILSGDADEEVSAAVCARLVNNAAGGDITIDVYPDATHDFDDPGRKRQGVPANASAAALAIQKTRAFVANLFARTTEDVPKADTEPPIKPK